jgi:hypothetical protein
MLLHEDGGGGPPPSGNRSPVGTPSEAIDRNFTVRDANTGMGQQKMVVPFQIAS